MASQLQSNHSHEQNGKDVDLLDIQNPPEKSLKASTHQSKELPSSNKGMDRNKMLSSAIKLSQGNGKPGGGKATITPATKIKNHATVWECPQGYEMFSHKINPKWDQQVMDPSLIDLFQDLNPGDQDQDQDLIDLLA